MNRKTFHRRAVLRGAGLAIGLPFLESLAPRAAWGATVKRLAVVFQCNGVNMSRWFPSSYGAITTGTLAGTALEPLGPYASKLLIPRGIHMVPRGYGRDPAGGDDHMKGMGHKLTAAPNAMTSERYPTGPSLDAVVAKGINPGGKGPLNLAVGPSSGGVLGSAFYTAAGQPAPMFRDPWKAFQSWTGTGGTTTAPAPTTTAPTGPSAAELAAMRRNSVLDVVKAQMDALTRNPVLSAADKRKLDMHFTAVRGLETAVAPAPSPSPTPSPTPEQTTPRCSLTDARTAEIKAIDPTAVTRDSSYVKVTEMMMDIMALAMACDHNRVVTIQLARGAGGPVYSWCGDTLNKQYNHHALSHGNTTGGGEGPTLDASWKTSLFNVDQWHMRMMRRLLDNMARYTEPGGSVLDNSAVLYMNELSDGLAHSFMDLPVLIAGSAGGYLKQGQYLKVTSATNTSNDSDAPSNMLLTTLANAVGYRKSDGSPLTTFGSAPTGKAGEFTALKA